MVVVYRRTDQDGIEVLVLHRAGRGPTYEGDWAWTPPAGQREPGEAAAACARREVLEETSLDLTPRPCGAGSPAWPVYLVEAAAQSPVSLAWDSEHDRYEWVSPAEAVARCRPEAVSRALQEALRLVQLVQATEG
jgi:8-oxo-dGTP pyrophosphatase MutT (NUDIX family)